MPGRGRKAERAHDRLLRVGRQRAQMLHIPEPKVEYGGELGLGDGEPEDSRTCEYRKVRYDFYRVKTIAVWVGRVIAKIHRLL